MSALSSVVGQLRSVVCLPCASEGLFILLIPLNKVTNKSQSAKKWIYFDVCKALGIGNPYQIKTRLDGDDLISNEVTTGCAYNHQGRGDGGYLCTTEVSTKSKNQYGEFIRTVTLLYVRPKHPYIDIKYVKKNMTILLSRFFFLTLRSIIRFSKPIYIIKVYEETKVL